MIGTTDLRGYNPIDTYQNLVTTAVDANGTSSIYNGTGSRIQNLLVTASFSTSASYEILYETSASWADFTKSGSYSDFAKSSSYSDFAKSASYADFAKSSSNAGFSLSSSYSQTASIISPSGGVVSDVLNATGSAAGTAGFVDAVALGLFIQNISQSFQTLNDLIAKLKSKGIIS